MRILSLFNVANAQTAFIAAWDLGSDGSIESNFHIIFSKSLFPVFYRSDRVSSIVTQRDIVPKGPERVANGTAGEPGT